MSRATLLIATALGLMGCPGDGPQEAVQPAVPTTSRELYDYLDAGAYRQFEHESAPHQSAGPHGGSVQVWVNDLLLQSLAAGNAQHPQGSAAIKELYDDAGAVKGWAAMIKATESAEGTAWFWYEVLSRGAAKADNPDYVGNGAGVCVECHSAGQGFIRIPFPLQ